MVTYRGSHRSPQPWLPLRTVEKGHHHRDHPAPIAQGRAPHSRSAPTFSPFTFAVTTVPSGLMMTPGSPFSPCRRGGDVRGDGGTRLPPMVGLASPLAPGGQAGWGTRTVTTPRGGGDPEQLPSTPGSPGDQTTPGLLSVPPGPAGRSTEPTSAPTNQRQTPNPPSITTTLAPLRQSVAGPATRGFTKVGLELSPGPPLWSPAMPPTHREASVTRSALWREAEMLVRANPLFPRNRVPSRHC